MQTITVQSLLSNDLRRAASRLSATLRATPVEKLDYKPSETARSIREIAQHALVGNGHCLAVIGVPSGASPAETDVEKLIADLEETASAIADYAERADDAVIGGEIQFFGRPMGVPSFLQTAEWHISRHAGQIDYVQTIYGDLEDHR